jgi:hypothetical protein
VSKLANTWKHPLTTAAGVAGAAFLAAAHQPNWKAFGAAFCVALLGALAKES